MLALAKGAARASGLCHHLSIFDAVWEIVYRVLRSPEGALLCAISTLGYQSRRAAKAVVRIAVQRSRSLTWGQIRCISVDKRASVLQRGAPSRSALSPNLVSSRRSSGIVVWRFGLQLRAKGHLSEKTTWTKPLACRGYGMTESFHSGPSRLRILRT